MNTYAQCSFNKAPFLISFDDAIIPGFARDGRALDDDSFMRDALDNTNVFELELECITLQA